MQGNFALGDALVNAFKLRLLLAGIGLVIGQLGFWWGSALAWFTIVFGVLHLVPYPIYVAWTRTAPISLLGGIALMVFPAVAYVDTHFDPNGVSFAYVTVPLTNIFVVAVIIAVDQLPCYWSSRKGRP